MVTLKLVGTFSSACDITLFRSKFETFDGQFLLCRTGVEVKFKNFVYPVLVNPIYVNEMTEIVYTEKGIRFGAAVTLNEINDVLKEQIATQPGTVICTQPARFHSSFFSPLLTKIFITKRFRILR